MRKVNLKDVQIGMVLAEPVYADNNLLLCEKGRVVNLSMKSLFSKFRVEHVYIDTVFEINISEIYKLSSLYKMISNSLYYYDINKIVAYSKEMVSTVLESGYGPTCSMLFKYDDATYQHMQNVASLSMIVGIKMNLRAEQLRNLVVGALLHDIGKVEVPSNVLHKKDKLTAEEVLIIKEHPVTGYRMLLGEKSVNSVIRNIVLYHHVNYDKTGYPSVGEEYQNNILYDIVHVCDVYEALCAKRSYKDAIPRVEVRQYLLDNRATLFNPMVVDTFIEHVPMYLIGEEIAYKNKTAIVLDNTNSEEPIVSIGKKKMKLSEFRR